MYLIILATVCLGVIVQSFLKRRTRIGDVALRAIQARMVQLKVRAKRLRAGGETNEVAMLAALWGLAVLPAENFPYVKQLFPAPSTSGFGGDGSSDSGGGCGGGGCGGGCGGCGG